MARILNIEVGNLITRVAEMDFKVKNPKVYRYFSMPTPKGMVEDGFVHESPEFVAGMKAALHENKIKTKAAVFVVSSSKIVTREVTIPAIKENQLGTYIKANANDYFPIDLAVYEIAHVLLGKEVGDDGKEKFRVMVMAAGKDLIAGYSQLAAVCGLKLSSIEYIGNSVYQVMKNECADEPTLVVRVEDNMTIASVIANGSMILQRTLAYGVERATKAVADAEYFKTDADGAFDLMTQKACLKVALNDRTRIIEKDMTNFESDQAEEARARVTATFAQLIGNLVRVIELYNSKDPLNAVRRVVLIGIGSEVINLPKLFRNEIGLETVVLKNFDSIAVTKVGDESISRYAGVFGAALNPVGIVADAKKGKEKKAVNYPLYTLLALLAAVGVIGYLFVSAYLPNKAAKDDETRLKGLEAQYAEAEVVHKQYLAVKDFYQDVAAKYALTQNNNDEMLSFLEEMETKFPSDVKLVSITSDNNSVNLVIHAADYEEAAKILQVLRTFDSLKSVSISSVAMKTTGSAEDEPAGLDFEVNCSYYPVSAE